jgi:hypothetical protein
MPFDKAAHVNSLIGNGWEESDRPALTALPDTVLEKIKPAAKTPPPPEPTGNAKKDDDKPRAVTMNDLSPELRRQVERGLKAESARKTYLIGVITGNEKNPFSKEYLESQELDHLEGLAALAAPDAEQNDAGMFMPGKAPAYFGAVGALPTYNAATPPPAAPKLAKDKALKIPGRALPVQKADAGTNN